MTRTQPQFYCFEPSPWKQHKKLLSQISTKNDDFDRFLGDFQRNKVIHRERNTIKHIPIEEKGKIDRSIREKKKKLSPTS